LNQTPITKRRSLNAFAYVAQVCAGLSRLLLIVAVFELITMPVTQHIWDWDHFLHGGQDFESGMLMIVTAMCLAFLLAMHCKQDVNLLLALRRIFLSVYDNHKSAGISVDGKFSLLIAEHPASPAPSMYSLPLQI
jgi:hypothetical protein